MSSVNINFIDLGVWFTVVGEASLRQDQPFDV